MATVTVTGGMLILTGVLLSHAACAHRTKAPTAKLLATCDRLLDDRSYHTVIDMLEERTRVELRWQVALRLAVANEGLERPSIAHAWWRVVLSQSDSPRARRRAAARMRALCDPDSVMVC